MILTYEQMFNRLAEKTVDNTRQLRRGVAQRRNGMEDLYGVLYSSDGDANHPATFYISLSPDYGYLERFAFKFVVKPYSTTVTGGTSSQIVVVDDAELEIENDAIVPNPHTHITQPHTHNLISGKSYIDTTSDYWRIVIDGIDITAYLCEQHDTEKLFEGEGIYPTNKVLDREDFYDILDVACMMTAEGDEESRERLLRPAFKKMQIISDAPFGIDAYLYLKYSHTNR